MAYEVLNNYLAVALLLVLLSLLPIIFDLIARSYEGLKLESEIQNSIMTRYFYYQLANVFVSVGLGSLANSLHQIIENPSSILSILGTSLPSLSIYFTNLLIVKTFTAVPLELLRVWPLLQILSVKMCLDRNKCTIRELKTGNNSSSYNDNDNINNNNNNNNNNYDNDNDNNNNNNIINNDNKDLNNNNLWLFEFYFIFHTLIHPCIDLNFLPCILFFLLLLHLTILF